MNKSKDILNNNKNYLKGKEKEISKSQIRANKLENKRKKLEKKQKNKDKKSKIIINKIIFYIIYNVIMNLLLFSYITSFINVFNIASTVQKTISIAALYIGVLSISILGAYTSAKIEKTLRDKSTKKYLDLNNKIETINNQIRRELELQESLKKEITILLDNVDKNQKSIPSTENNHNYINKEEDYLDDSFLEEIHEMPYIKRRKKY